jgi:AraC-like DNA-binding protein
MGFAGRAMARHAGIAASALDVPGARLPLAASTRLWRAAIDATGDPYLGLKVSRYARLTALYGLSDSAGASVTVRDALERIAWATRVMADGSQGCTHLDTDYLDLVCTWTSAAFRPCDEALDAVFTSIVRATRFIADSSFSPFEVWLDRPEPPDPSRFTSFFNCPVHFGATETRLAFDLTAAQRQIRAPSPIVSGAFDTMVGSRLDGLDDAHRVSRQVRDVIMDLFPIVEPTEALVAARLAWSPRSLQRRLQEEGTTFRELLGDCRRDVALASLRVGSHSVTQLSNLLGFSHVSAFSRAFKRWTGQTPSAYALGSHDPVTTDDSPGPGDEVRYVEVPLLTIDVDALGGSTS